MPAASQRYLVERGIGNKHDRRKIEEADGSAGRHVQPKEKKDKTQKPVKMAPRAPINSADRSWQCPKGEFLSFHFKTEKRGALDWLLNLKKEIKRHFKS